MFRKILLSTTALVVATTLANAGGFKPSPKPVSQPQHKGIIPTIKHNGIANQGVLSSTRKGAHVHNVPPFDQGTVTYSNLSRDPNAQFLSWYGFFASSSCFSYYQSHSYHYYECFYENSAVPFPGADANVSEIIVPVYAQAGDEFFVGLYKDSDGSPGNLIAGASVSGSSITYCCHLEIAKIGHHYLKAGQQYWVEVTGLNDYGLWLTEDTDYSKPQLYDWHYGYYETYNFDYGTTYTTSYNSGWLASTNSPYRPAFEIK